MKVIEHLEQAKGPLISVEIILVLSQPLQVGLPAAHTFYLPVWQAPVVGGNKYHRQQNGSNVGV